MVKKDNPNYNILKYRGIPINTGETQDKDYIRAYIPTKSVGGKKDDPKLAVSLVAS